MNTKNNDKKKEAPDRLRAATFRVQKPARVLRTIVADMAWTYGYRMSNKREQKRKGVTDVQWACHHGYEQGRLSAAKQALLDLIKKYPEMKPVIAANIIKGMICAKD